MINIYEKKLANGFIVTCNDQSKTIAGDRWQVCLKCTAKLPLLPWMNDHISELKDARPFIIDSFNGFLTYDVEYVRNFIDGAEKEDVLAALLQRADNMICYLEKDDFVSKYFNKKIEELMKNFNSQSQVADEGEYLDEDEKTDFSSCFKD